MGETTAAGVADRVAELALTVIGSINVDVSALVERLPQAGETIGGGRLVRGPGGKGGNQAAAAARLGARVRMIGAVGGDADGEWLLAELADAGVETAGIRVTTEPTGCALIAIDSEGENQIAVCEGANAAVSLEGVEFSPTEVVLTQLEIDLATVEDLARRASGFLAVNAAPARPLPEVLVERVDLFIVNESEWSLMPELRAARRVVVTLGADGAALFERGIEVARVPAMRVDVVNTVGAGDAFCAALTIGFAVGLDAETALTAACAVGADAVGHAEAQPGLRGFGAYLM